MNKTLRTLVLLATAGASSAFGQIVYNSFGTPLVINFNNLNTNFGGAYNSSGGSSLFPTTDPPATTVYSGAVNPGLYTSFTDFSPGGVYSNTGIYSNSNSMRALRDGSTSDFALGLKDSSDRTITLRMQNTTGVALNNWTVGYVVEQYSKGASATSFLFSYSLNGSTFITTNMTGGQAVVANNTTPIDVNLASVGATSRTAVITTSIANNAEIYFRWTYDHASGTSVHMGIDDITITAIPEPSAAAALLGGLVLAGVVGVRRRRRV